MVVEGKLHAKFDTQQVSDTFKKKEFVLDYQDNPLYPQYVTFQLVQDRVGLIDSFQIGDKIEITFNLRGREYTTPQGEKKYFNTLEAWRINKAGESNGDAPSQPVYDTADISGAQDDLPW